ncbi:hypothetical protein ACCO45_004925 [Purpureocillium lilacinum]|uniref:Uncharacterized protein n=1 Tax=Purpureocillium lilacinum TaxID=33203 RepID=A0ACC4DUW8_PURLI
MGGAPHVVQQATSCGHSPGSRQFYVQLGPVAGRGGGGGGGGSFTSRATDYLWEHNHGQGIRAVVIGAVQVGFFCPARAFGACTSNPEHSTAPPWKGREPSSSDALRFEARLSPPGPNIASAARLGGACSHSPPGLQVPDIRSSGGLVAAARPGNGSSAPKPWAGLQVGRTGGLPALGDPVPVVVTGGVATPARARRRCISHAGSGDEQRQQEPPMAVQSGSLSGCSHDGKCCCRICQEAGITHPEAGEHARSTA